MEAAPYGSWKSPITAQMVAAGTLRLSEVKLVNERVYWLESRPSEAGRTTLMAWDHQSGERELLSKEYNVRTRAHEYGGGALLIEGDKIYFVNDKDQQIYSLKPHGEVQKITSCEKTRFADGCLHSSSLIYVREEHGAQVTNSIVKIDPCNGHIETLLSGHDFYANPRISPDGRSLAYLSWDHPNMPWDETELWVLDLDTRKQRKVAGGPSESIVDPQWSPDAQLYYVSDRTNWWNLYKEQLPEPLWAVEGEFALPQWVFGRSLFGFASNGIFCSYIQNGSALFAHSLHGKWEPLKLPYSSVGHVAVANTQVAMLASAPDQPQSIVLLDVNSGQSKIIKSCRSDKIDPQYISLPKAIEFPSAGGRVAHAFYYPPCNPQFCGTPNEKPPLIVRSHGGPTAHTTPTLSPEILYWTSRGFAYIDVNYGGSTGYGRAYRDLLKGSWGIVDVDDCTYAALYCASVGLADRDRLAIKGESAGGYTTLAALAFRDVFKVGADYFGVSDLEGLATDTHKFESRYLDQLIGPYPEMKATYIARSPIHSIDKITCPVIIFQGDEDAIVPPSQSEAVYKSLLARHIPTAYLLYSGEQHGFRKVENIQRSLEAQLYFFSQVLRFPLSEPIEPVLIEQ